MENSFTTSQMISTEKNVDRVKFKGDKLLACLYELKDEKKTGGLVEYTLVDGKYTENNTISTNYGILDLSFQNESIVTSNSDSSVTFFTKETQQNIPLSIQSNCANVLHVTEDKVGVGLNDGSITLVDSQKAVSLFSVQAHEYSIWAVYFLDENTLLSGSDDCKLVLTDTRTGK